VLRDGEVTRNVNAQHLQTAIACDSWQQCGLWYTPSLAPTVTENYLAGLATIQVQTVAPLSKKLYVQTCDVHIFCV